VDRKKFQDAVLLFDKSKGITSYRAIEEVQRLLGINKVGHSGTLDKSASGLLVICTGLATKLTRYFLDSDKRYTGKIKLGVTTDTDDEEGAVVETREVRGIDGALAAEIEGRFSGEIEQVPPRYSALKISGRRASDRVRDGEAVVIKPRRVAIRELKVVEADPAAHLLSIEVLCSKGTYIRSLARDIGSFLGTGAFLQDLRRTGSGAFSVEDAVTIGELTAAAAGENVAKRFLYDPVDSLPDFGRIEVKDAALKKVRNGADFGRDDIVRIDARGESPFIIIDGGKNLIAIASIDVDNWSIRYLNVFNR
jgi:tRNA pseudouridine55 synthase